MSTTPSFFLSRTESSRVIRLKPVLRGRKTSRARSAPIATQKAFGGNAQVQAAMSSPSIRSRWEGGYSTGWWRCAIDLVGEEVEIYSVEASPFGLSANPDNGAKAFGGVALETPKGFNSWIKRSCGGWFPRDFC